MRESDNTLSRWQQLAGIIAESAEHEDEEAEEVLQESTSLSRLRKAVRRECRQVLSELRHRSKSK